MEEVRVAARDLRVDDVLPHGGTITKIITDLEPGVVTAEIDYGSRVGPWNHGDPVLVLREVRGIEG